jgi:hypothetical protein
MQKVGLWSNLQFNLMWEQSKLVSLTWVYCICHYSSGVNRWPVGYLFFLLLLESAKPQPPNPFNVSDNIRTWSQLETNNGF